MTIAVYCDSDVYAGTESHILTLARGLRALDSEVCLVCPEPSPLAEKAAQIGIAVFPAPKQGMIDRRAMETLAALLRSKRIQIVHTHNGRTHLNAVLAIQRAGSGICIATQHFISPNHSEQRGLKAWLYGMAHRWVSRRTARFIAISQAVKQGMVERGEAPEGRIVVVPNGIDAPEIANNGGPSEIRAGLGISPASPLIVCTARLEKEKDIATLVAAMRQVVDAVPSARCVVAGDGALRETLAAQINEFGLKASVKLLGFRKDALALIRAADVFVLPSLAEPFGLVILEAMALGRPVVATRAGGPMEIVVDGQTGLLAQPSDPSSLASALLRMLNWPEEASRMGAAGRVRYLERYQSSHMARATLQVYNDAARTASEARK